MNCVINLAHQKGFGALVEMTFGLVHASYSLHKRQAVKLTFFAPCGGDGEKITCCTRVASNATNMNRVKTL